MRYKQEQPNYKYIAPGEIMTLSEKYFFLLVFSKKKKRKLFLKFYLKKNKIWLEEGNCRPSF